jgi:hypothetical protein
LSDEDEYDQSDKESMDEDERIIQPRGSFDSYQQLVAMERCMICGYRPCAFLKYEEEFRIMHQDIIEQFPADTTMTKDDINRIFRHSAYTAANTWLNGPRGKHNRAPLPECMELGIRTIGPSTVGYTNFREAPP